MSILICFGACALSFLAGFLLSSMLVLGAKADFESALIAQDELYRENAALRKRAEAAEAELFRESYDEELR